MDRFTKAAILVTIIIILSNLVLIYFDLQHYKESTNFLLNVIIYKILNIILFSTLIILKLVFKKAVNYLFICFFTSIFALSILSMVSFIIQDSYNKLNSFLSIFKANIWLPISCDILWLFMFIFLYFNRHVIRKNESNYFLKKDQTNENLKSFKHGLIFWLLSLLMLVNLFFIVRQGDMTDIFASGSGFSTLTYIICCALALIAIFKQSFSMYLFFACMTSYLILQAILPTFVNFFLTGSTMPLSQKIVLICVQLVSMSAIVTILLQANSQYRKIKYQQDAI